MAEVVLYTNTYCVKCRQKTQWKGSPSLALTRNCKAGLRGVCIQCGKTKFTFITTAYYQTRL